MVGLLSNAGLYPLAAAPYAPISVLFDGTNDGVLWGSGLTGAADSDEGTISFWVRHTATDTHRLLAWSSTANPGVTIGSGNTCNFLLPNGGVDLRSAALTQSSWNHIALSWLRNNYYHYAVNGTVITPTENEWTDGVTDFTTSAFSIGQGTTGGDRFTGSLADVCVWIGTGKSLDLTVGSNLAKFIAAGIPVDPEAASGMIATLGTPIVGCGGRDATVANWHENGLGSGGAGTEVGELTAGDTPVEVGG